MSGQVSTGMALYRRVTTLMRGGASYALAGRSIQYAAQLVLVLALPGLLLPEYYVQFNLLVPIASLAAALIMGWFTGAAYRHVHDLLDPANGSHRETAAFYYGFVSLALLAVYAAGVAFVSSKLHLIPLLVVATGLKAGILGVLNAAERHRLFFLVNTGFAAALAVFLALCAWTPDEHLPRNLAIYAALDVLIAAAAWTRIGVFTVSRLPHFDPDIGRRYFLYGMPLLATSLATWVISLSDRYLLALWTPASEVASYILSYQLGGAIITVPMSFLITVVFPRIIRLDRADGEEAALAYTFRLARIYRRSMLAIVALGSGVVIPLIHFLYPAYELRPAVVVLIVLAHVIWGLAGFYNKKFELNGRTIIVTRSVATGAAVNVVMNVALIPFWGALGAAIATLIAYCASTYVVYRANR